MFKILFFILIFISGEIIFNLTWYKYLKNYFSPTDDDILKENEINTSPKKFLFMNLSTFKGIFERLIITIGLILNFLPILIVFGTIKLGTRFKDNQDIKNDYFLIGNFSSILISIFYYWVLKQTIM